MDKWAPEFEHDAKVAVLAAVLGLTALRRSITTEVVLRDASRRLLSLRGPAVSRYTIERHVRAAMKRLYIGERTRSDTQMEQNSVNQSAGRI